MYFLGKSNYFNAPTDSFALVGKVSRFQFASASIELLQKNWSAGTWQRVRRRQTALGRTGRKCCPTVLVLIAAFVYS